MRVLSISIELAFDRLQWFVEGLALIHQDSKEHKRAVAVVKGARRLAMAGDRALADEALDSVAGYVLEGEAFSVNRRVQEVRKTLQRQ